MKIENAIKIFEIILIALACPLALPMVLDDENDEEEQE